MDSSFQPLNAVENYESLIWSERYSDFGDFELTSSDIAGMVSLLPREACVCLRESTVPMIVENYAINKPAREKPTITITGRSYETVLERRVAVNTTLPATYSSVPFDDWDIDATKESDAAYLAMRIVLGDAPRYQGSTMVLPLTNPAVSPLDAIAEIDLILPADYIDIIGVAAWSATPPVAYTAGSRAKYAGFVWRAIAPTAPDPPTITDPSKWEKLYPWSPYEIKAQNLYGSVMELLNTNRRGLKAVRPVPGDFKIGIEIYNGANLTGEGETGDPNHVVVFDARFDQFDDTTYLLSAQGSANVAYVYGSNGAQTVLKNAAAEPTGLARRVLFVDQSSDTATSSADVRKTRGLIELYKYNATALFDGQIAEQVAEGYDRDYFLGDILKLTGEFGLSQNARVAEFIRTSDATGSKAYPTFEAVDD